MSFPVQPSDLSDHPVLILDDEVAVLHSLRESLERAGYCVITASSPLKALELVRDRTFSVILTDMRMPEMTGLEFLEHCEAMQPDATRVLITAVLSLSSVLDAINSGRIYRFIPKPWLHEELLAAIENSVQRYMLTMRNQSLAEEAKQLRAELEAKHEELVEAQKSLETARHALQSAKHQGDRRSHRSIELCWRILTTHDPSLGDRTRTIAALARAVATAGSFSEHERHILETAAWLCDLGLLKVPSSTIHASSTELSETERSLIRHHPIYSETLAAFLDDDDALATTIRAHHEHIDGTGYPDGLRGTELSWTARCLAVIAAFVESGLSRHDAIEQLVREAGRRFDADAVRLFIKATENFPSPRQAREVAMDQLQPGMILSQGLYSSGGMLLVPEGNPLTPAAIEKIRCHHLAAPTGQRLLVYS